MRNALATAALLALASCRSAYYEGRDEYHEGMHRMRYDPAQARDHLGRSASFMAEALEDGDLYVEEQVTATTIRARALIETDRHAEAAALLALPIEGFDPARAYTADTVGLSLLRAQRMDPERAYAELLLTERRGSTLRARVHAAWQQVRVLRLIGTDKAKAEAVRVCERNSGRLDFDAQKQALGAK